MGFGFEKYLKTLAIYLMDVATVVLYCDTSVAPPRSLCKVHPICSWAFLSRTIWLSSWRAGLCRRSWILYVRSFYRAIFLFFLCRAWQCDRIFLAILLILWLVFACFFQRPWCPYSKSWLPSELYVQAQLANDSFSHRPTDEVTSQWEFCKLSCMPRVH